MSIGEYFEYIGNQLASIGIIDIIDILIVAVIFYIAFRFVRNRRAGRLLIGILILIAMLLISDLAQMRALNFILSQLFSVGIIAIIVLFQPELRSALEKMGGESIRGIKSRLDKDELVEFNRGVTEICIAAEALSQSKTGALIVIERNTKLGDYILTGTVVDAQISSFLLENIFFNKAPMHDGAVIVRKSRVFAAGCFLPLSTNSGIIKELGTRHRAGIGMSENSDAVVVIVSEETGVISVAVDGELKRGFSRKTLEDYLNNLLSGNAIKGISDMVKDKFFGNGKKSDGTEKNENRK